MDQTTSLYDTDFLLWSEEQARRLRAASAAGASLPIDWENVAEEIEDLGKSRRQELRERLVTIVEHLLKLRHSPAREPRPGWVTTIGRSRLAVEELLAENPSLAPVIDEYLPRANQEAGKLVKRELAARGESPAPPPGADFTRGQILGDWWESPEPP